MKLWVIDSLNYVNTEEYSKEGILVNYCLNGNKMESVYLLKRITSYFYNIVK